MRFDSKEAWAEWNSLDFFPKSQFEAWRSALSDSHLKWSLDKSPSTGFSGEIKMRHLGGIRLLYCACDTCNGKRTPSEINKSEGEYFGLLYIYEGSEIVFHENQASKLEKNSFTLWDSTKPIEFKLLSKIKKVTLLVPQDRLRAQFPQVDNYIGKNLDCSKGLGAVTASHIAALGSEANAIDNGSGDLVVDLTLELITTCLQGNTHQAMSKAKQELFDSIIKFIQKNLEFSELGPCFIANEFNISTRYLHSLFAEKGISMGHWIRDKRLEQCRRQLVHVGRYKTSITDIAFQWGFNDSAHFSKVFKKKYGITPSEYQKRHFNPIGGK
ncbi:helix-turn-helix domain-containing protein [Geosporobacter ferrireducens]|uniref:helix-turn-helix domain-containing protein n=1 Tax=Geosporobacter ferrireducens TaxID=1424294 RepID=UPI00139B15BC|nr:helix-turn-helix domain-containing protein [Geosporobacter ferrireducens]MTI54735.1 helix-turn-helix domain-containing protein [Geosporobacter ferrireducens]